MSPTLFLVNGLLEGSMILDSIYRWYSFLQTGTPSQQSLFFDASQPFAATTVDFFNCAAFSIGFTSLFIYFSGSASRREVALPVAIGTLPYHIGATLLIYLNNFVFTNQLGPLGVKVFVYGLVDEQVKAVFPTVQLRTMAAGVLGCTMHGLLAVWFLTFILFGRDSSSSSKRKVKTA